MIKWIKDKLGVTDLENRLADAESNAARRKRTMIDLQSLTWDLARELEHLQRGTRP